MENDSQNLKIRVVMKPGKDTGVSTQYRYNWGRVALIAVPVVLLLVLAVKFLSGTPDIAPANDIASSTEAPPAPAASQPEPAEAADTTDVAAAAAAEAQAVEEQDVLARARQLAASNALLEQNTQTEEPVAEQPEPEQQLSAQQPASSAGQSSMASAAAEQQAPPAIEQAPPVSEPVATETIAESAAAPEPTSSSSGATLLPGQKSTLSPKVKRFQLTNGIADKEPRGDLEDIVPGSDGLIRVYVFSEVTNMKDEFIHYRWIHNGQQQANVKIGVWSNRWRSNSSKFIAANMHGDWQVRMENSDGELLAEASFSY